MRHRSGWRAFGIGLWIALAGASWPAWAQGPASRADFDGDGFEDLAIGVPGHANGAGAWQVLYGSASGLTASGNQLFSQNSSGIGGGEEPDDGCGVALAAGDFNGDGESDLAVGCPGEELSGGVRMGVVLVLYGGPSGLSGSGSQFWHQDASGVLGTGAGNDRCGTSLATGDWNGDGRADLAWGCAGERVAGTAGAGAVNVLFGSASGLTAAGDQLLSLDVAGSPVAPGLDDRCGTTLAAGDFDGDGRTDLAMGCPGAGFNGLAVVFFSSGAGGLSGTGSVIAERKGAISLVSAGCGKALAAGDVDGDGRDDLALGCPTDSPLFLGAGAAHLLYGTSTGFRQGGALGAGFFQLDRCGTALAAGDVDGDGLADLASGCPGMDVAAGRVRVFPGSPNFVVTESDVEEWHQNVPGIGGSSEAFDNFGGAVAFGDFDGDGFDDLAVGVPQEDLSAGSDVGSVTVIYGTRSGLQATGSQFWSQDTAGVVGGGAPSEQFGYALSGSSGPSSVPGLTGSWDELALRCPKGRGDGRDARRDREEDGSGKGPGARCELRGSFTVRNPSTASTPRVALRFYLSRDAVLDEADLLLDEVRVRALFVGESQGRRLRAALPSGVDARGQFVIAFVDADDVVEEENEANNVVASDRIE